MQVFMKEETSIENLRILSERKCKKKHHVSYDTVLGLENEFLKNSGCKITYFSRFFVFLNKALRKTLKKDIADRKVYKGKNDVYFYVAMGISDIRENETTLRFLSLKGCKVAVYCFDTWETAYDEWEKIFRQISPSFIFLAYKHSYEYFSKIFDNVHFLPQSMDSEYFHERKCEKTRMFMQMGRRSDKIHKMILTYMENHGISDTDNNYVYERIKGNIIHPNTKDLAENICLTKYFVCAPQSLENRQLTGNVSDVTARFYEAMASKTLIIGYKPYPVYDELFPKDSMVVLSDSDSDFKEKIDFFENNPSEYERIVNENYNMVMSKHMWKNRLEYVMKTIMQNAPDTANN